MGFRDWGFEDENEDEVRGVVEDEDFVIESDGVVFFVRFFIILGRKVFLAINEA